LGVGSVGWGRFHGGDEVLVEEDLANVGNVSTCISSIWESCTVEMGGTVDVGCTSGVVTREYRRECCDSELVGLLDASKEGRVDVVWVAVSVSGSDDSSIDSGAVTG